MKPFRIPWPAKIADKLGSAVLPMVAEGVFFAFPGAFSLLAPESVSPVAGRPAVRRNYVEIAKAAAAFWRLARGSRAVFDRYWPPQNGGCLERPPACVRPRLA